VDIKKVRKEMNSFRILFDRRVGVLIVAVALLLATFLPTLAFAAQLTQRSIALSSSSAGADNVTYEVKFTAVGDAEATIIDFCGNSPLINQTCTPAAGFDATGVAVVTASSTAGLTASVLADDANNNTVQVDGSFEASDNVTVTLESIDNPSAAGPLFARIVTYNATGEADDYTSANIGDNVVDQGGAAVQITPTIGVSGAVMETMTFCVSGQTIGVDCTSGVTSPVLKLGEGTGDVKALTPGTVSTGDIYTQITTNAVNGAVISLKSSALGCGGLVRTVGPTNCDILPALQTGIANGDSKFGVKTNASFNTSGVTLAQGTLQPISGSGYNNSTYALNFDEDDETGVTSVFGDAFLDTNNAPANNKNMMLTFGATVNNNTPAGIYSTDLSLIATGKF
jgi:hypothetical protein